MNTYTDPKLLDVAGALDVLPELPLKSRTIPTAEPMQATGTDGENATIGVDSFVPLFVPTSDDSSALRAIADKSARRTAKASPIASDAADKGLALADERSQKAGDATRTRNVQLGRLVLYH